MNKAEADRIREIAYHQSYKGRIHVKLSLEALIVDVCTSHTIVRQA